MKYRWVICGLLFLATFINYFDRQILALLKPTLDDQFKWSETEYGYVTAAFQTAYAIGLLGFGWFVDRFGIRLGYTISIFAWSLAAMGHALVTSIFGFGVARAALGLGEGGNFPCCIKTVANWFPASQRAFATSVFNAGSNMGALVAPAVVPVLAVNYGWRAPFIFAGVIGMLWIGLWIPFFREPFSSEQNAEQLAEKRQEATAPVNWLSLFRFPQMWAFTVAKVITDPIWWFYLIWLPDYFKASRGLDMQHSGHYLVTIYSIVTGLSIIGCWFAGRLIASLGLTTGRKLAMLLFAFLVLPVYFTGQASDWGAVLLIGLAGAAHQAWSANLYSAVSDSFPKQMVSSVVGFGGMAGSASSAFFPILTGMILDHFKALGSIKVGYGYLFAFCSVVYLIAFALHHLLAPSFKNISFSIDQKANLATS